MPLYEYRCTKCSHTFEKIQKFSDSQPTECPKCGGKIEQVISAPSVQFKGAGWYVNDYAKKGSSGKGGPDVSSSSDTKSEGKSESTAENKSDSKSEAKTEKKSSDSSSSDKK